MRRPREIYEPRSGFRQEKISKAFQNQACASPVRFSIELRSTRARTRRRRCSARGKRHLRATLRLGQQLLIHQALLGFCGSTSTCKHCFAGTPTKRDATPGETKSKSCCGARALWQPVPPQLGTRMRVTTSPHAPLGALPANPELVPAVMPKWLASAPSRIPSSKAWGPGRRSRFLERPILHVVYLSAVSAHECGSPLLCDPREVVADRFLPAG